MHHEEWSLIKKENKRGRLLHEAAEEVRASWIIPNRPTCKEKVGRKVKQSRIDWVCVKGVEVIETIGKTKLALDHWGLLIEVERDQKLVEVERESINWDRVDETLGKNKKKGEVVSFDWYHKLKGNTKYDKLLQFRKDHLKKFRISSRSKRWWDDDLSDLLKKLRKARRGGRKKKNGGC